MTAFDFPIEWERLIWSARPHLISAPGWRRERFALTDLRLVVHSPRAGIVREIAIDDVGSLGLKRTRWQRVVGTSDLIVRPRRLGAEPLVLPHLHRSDLLALILHLFAHDACDPRMDADLVHYAIEGIPRRRGLPAPRAAAALAIGLSVVAAVDIRLDGNEVRITYAADDAIYPGGVKRTRAEIVEVMQRRVMPWAREALAPVVGGPHRVTCVTCHGSDAEARGWRMPGVSDLPYPRVRTAGLEIYGHPTDPQVRNAIYADLAQEDRQHLAGYMRMIVMPGMASLLNRPAYDFSRSFRENRSRAALGCYHCHRVTTE